MAAESTYTPIATVTSTGSTATVSFTSISSTYTDLFIAISARSSQAINTSNMYVQFNSDTGANYSSTRITGDGSTTISQRDANTDYPPIGNIPGNNTAASTFGDVYININNYANANKRKAYLCRSGAATSTSGKVWISAGLWRNTAAITSVQIVCDGISNFSSGSTFTLYGIKAA